MQKAINIYSKRRVSDLKEFLKFIIKLFINIFRKEKFCLLESIDNTIKNINSRNMTKPLIKYSILLKFFMQLTLSSKNRAKFLIKRWTLAKDSKLVQKVVFQLKD